MTGVANARPVSAAAGTAKSDSGRWPMRNSVITTQKAAVTITIRTANQATSPNTRSRTATGVASIAS